MSLEAELREVKLRVLRALLVRLDAGHGYSDGRVAADTFFRDRRDRELLGNDPLRPRGGHGKGAARVAAQLTELEAAPPAGPLSAMCDQLALPATARALVAASAGVSLDAEIADLCRALAGGRVDGIRVDLAAELWGLDPVAAVGALSDDSQPVLADLVALAGTGPAATRGLTLRPRVAAWLAGVRALSDRLAAVAELTPAGDADREIWLPDDLRETIDAWRADADRGDFAILVHGPQGAGKRGVAQLLADRSGRPLLAVDLPLVLRAPEPTELARDLLVEARLHDAVLYLAGCEQLDGDDRWEARAVARRIERHAGPLVLATREAGGRRPSLRRRLRAIVLSRPTLEARRAAWQHTLDAAGVELPRETAAELADRYVIGPGTIAEIVGDAANGGPVSRARLHEAIGHQLSLRLGSFGALVSRRATFDQMVVPEDVLESLLDLLAMVRERSRILERWGFADHLGLSRGVSALFLGAPGTGKTMAASAIAGELGLPLFRIDLAAVISKWIGETEKHLARIFDEAQSAQALLLFDEADSLFGKRTEVKTSNDRYANVEVNYLLQRMETFDGITILTSNLESGIDPAFMRRISFRIRFPEPDADERAALWRTLLPRDAELSEPPDFEELAERFELTGGHIRNAIVRAAVLAAREDRAITGRDLIDGARHEYHELGKVTSGPLRRRD